MATSTVTTDRSIAERRFYTGISFVILMIVFLGFGRSFFLKPLFPSHPAPPELLFSLHGAVFSLWIILFMTQTLLVGRGNLALHRQLGVFGGILALCMVGLGVFSALTAAARPSGFVGIPVPPLQFLAIPLFDMVVFPFCVAMAFLKRHELQDHKRWMLLATINIVTAAIARLPIIETLGPIGFFAVTDLLIVALGVWDFRSRGKLHRVTLWGGLLTVIFQPLRLFIAGTDAWQSFAAWAVGLLG